MQSGIRVFLIDPHPAFRRAMLRFLSGIVGVEIVGQHATLAAALPEIGIVQPDLILYDPGSHQAAAVVTAWGGQLSSPRLILLTTHGQTPPSAATLPADAVLDKAEFGTAILPLLVHLFPAAMGPQLSEDTNPVRIA